MKPHEIIGSRSKTLLHLAISFGFMLIGLWLIRSPDGGGWAGWPCLTFFGIGVPVFGWTLLHPQRLTLDPEGFLLSGGLVLSPRKVRWCDIKSFVVHRLPRGGKMIGYNYADGARTDTLLSHVNRRLGVDAALPKAWPGSPERLVAKLNDYRERSLAMATPPA